MSALTHRERPPEGDAAGLLVLHHGRGADEHDLLGLADGRLIEESAALGEAAAARLRAAAHPTVREVRQRGLWLGIELADEAVPARRASERLMEQGVLAKDTHETTLRIAPPLTVTAEELDWALERVDEVLAGLP